jgi:hypothetical protein
MQIVAPFLTQKKLFQYTNMLRYINFICIAAVQ